MEVVEPELVDAFEAASAEPKTVSFQDHLCLLTAKRHGYACITNDKMLRKECAKHGVDVVWGLELIVWLHAAKGIEAASAIKIADGIHTSRIQLLSAPLLV
jgi:hypothetical protein